jgi:hypothetical protein
MERKTDRALRMLNLDEFLNKKFNCVTFTGEWRDLIGNPAICGIWIMWGASSNGKTTGAIKLAKYLTRFEKAIYWSKEENASATLQMAFHRAEALPSERKRILIPQRSENMESMVKKLREPKSPRVIFFDSLQIFERMYGSQFFYDLKEEFSEHKLLIFISQADGKNPKGNLGDNVRYDADVKMRVEGHRIFSESRISGSKPKSFVTIWEEKAREYWGELSY